MTPRTLASIDAELVQTITDMFAEQRVPVAFGLALAWVESNFNPAATRLVGGDAARGGAYGLCQMTFRTATELDSKVTLRDLMDAEYNAHLAARLCSQNLLLLRTNANGIMSLNSAATIYDLAALYNSGKVYAKAPKVTKDQYVPTIYSGFCFYRAEQLATGTHSQS